MDRMDFTHAVARLRVWEKKFINKNDIEKLLDAETPEEVMKTLQETSYGSLVSEVDSIYDYESILKSELLNLYSDLYKISPVKEVIDIMTLKYDYHNLKVLLKGKYLGKDLSHILMPIGTTSLNDLKEAVMNDELKNLNIFMQNGIKKVEEEFEETKDPQIIDTQLDKSMFLNMLSVAEKLDIPYIVDYVKHSIDITNIKAMLRVKKQKKEVKFLQKVLIPGGTIDEEILLFGLNDTLEAFIGKISRTPYSKVLHSILDEYISTGNISSLEVLYDNFIIDEAKTARRVNFGPEPIIAYIIAKESEIKIIRIIVAGKINNVDIEVIRERLRELYV